VTALVIFVFAALARIVLNDVDKFSRADETAMLRLSSQVTKRNYDYRTECARWFDAPDAWYFPGIIRYGNILLVGGLMRLFGKVTFRVPSSISTVSGIASVALTWVIARRLSPGSETYAIALAATSPLQLHLGRRALQDQLVCAAMLSAIAAAITGHLVLACLSLAALLSIKETMLSSWPAFFGCFWLARVPLLSAAAVLVVAPALFLIGLSILARDPLVIFRFFKPITSARHHPYGRFQEGAPNRLPVDLLLTAPLVFMAAARSGMTAAVAFVLLQLGAHAVIPIIRALRMVTTGEAMLRIVAAAVIAKWDPVVAVTFIAVNAYSELMLFRRVFVQEEVYDPVTPNLIRALGMSPKEA
jgi:hypothetical protein